MTFLGHIIESHYMHIDIKKYASYFGLDYPYKGNKLQSFLGLANYYHKFIEGYSKKATPLIDLLKKAKWWEWTARYEMTFQELNNAIAFKLMLRLSNFEALFEVHIDVLDKTIGGMLMQENHLLVTLLSNAILLKRRKWLLSCITYNYDRYTYWGPSLLFESIMLLTLSSIHKRSCLYCR